MNNYNFTLQLNIKYLINSLNNNINIINYKKK